MAPTAPPLTREEFVSLRDGAKGLMHRIPSEHKARLIELGYIEEVFGGIRLTSAGRMRIAEGSVPDSESETGSMTGWWVFSLCPTTSRSLDLRPHHPATD